MLIGISGLAGSGKDEIGKYLSLRKGFLCKKFAQPLKDMILALPGVLGDDLEGLRKEKKLKELNDKSPRHAMQTLGTEWGRKHMGEDFWVNVLKRDIDNRLKRRDIVITDVRFPNEVDFIQDNGGFIGTVRRPTGTKMDHVSEKYILDLKYDVMLKNYKKIDDLGKEIEAGIELCQLRTEREHWRYHALFKTKP